MYRHLGINDSMKLEQRRRPMTRETWEANLKYQRRLFGEFADRARYQIARRLWALLDALIADVPKKRRRPLVAQGTLLDDAVASAIPHGQRADALVPDRQGVDGEAQTWPPVSISTTTRVPGGSEQEPAPGGGLRPVGP